MPGDYQCIRLLVASTAVLSIGLWTGLLAHAERPARVYHNRLMRLKNPAPLLADYPQFVQPVIEKTRYEAPVLIGTRLPVRWDDWARRSKVLPFPPGGTARKN